MPGGSEPANLYRRMVFSCRIVVPLLSLPRRGPTTGRTRFDPTSVQAWRADSLACLARSRNFPHVAKVENRTTLEISRKSIFGLLCCCVDFQRHYRGCLEQRHFL